MIWNQLDIRANLYHLGFIPDFLSNSDPRSAAEQFAANYAHGGGWNPLQGWAMNEDHSIKYPGDRAIQPIFFTILHDGQPNAERIFVYPHAWVAIVAADDSYEIARID